MKPTTKKILIISAIAAVAAGIIYFLYRKNKAKQDEINLLGKESSLDESLAEIAVKSPTSTPQAKLVCVRGDAMPLREGSCGPRVKYLQQYLNSVYGAGLVEDGVLGPITTEAMLNYLKRDNISQDLIDKFYASTDVLSFIKSSY